MKENKMTKFRDFDWEQTEDNGWQSCLHIDGNSENKIMGKYIIIPVELLPTSLWGNKEYAKYLICLDSKFMDTLDSLPKAKEYCNKHWQAIMSLYIIE